MKITMTIDTERLAEFGGGDESIQDFVNRMVAERRTGGTVVWTTTTANVGTIDKVTAAVETEDAIAPGTLAGDVTPQQLEAADERTQRAFGVAQALTLNGQLHAAMWDLPVDQFVTEFNRGQEDI